MEDTINFIYDTTSEGLRQIMLACQIARSLKYPTDDPDSDIKSILRFCQGFNMQPVNTGPAMIPNYVTHLDLGNDFNKRIEPGSIPNSVTHLTFGNSFDHKLYPGMIPDSVTHLTFGDLFNHILDPEVLPNSITHLIFGKNYDKEIEPGTIPESVTHLTFKGSFDTKKISNYIPCSVTHLNLVTNVIKWNLFTLGSIPNTITHLWFRNDGWPHYYDAKKIHVFHTIQEIKFEDTVWKNDTPEFEEMFTVYRPPAKGAHLF